MKSSLLILVTCLLMLSLPNQSLANAISKTGKSPQVNTQNIQTAVFGLGCFWGAEKKFAKLYGVRNVISGYADGRGFKATYKNIVKRSNRHNPDNYAEVIKVTYNSTKISYAQLVRTFFELHDPTQGNRQGNDIGTQYRSIILTTNEAQQEVAQQLLNDYQVLLTQAKYGKITTIIKPLEKFFAAEEYHQDYLVKNPNGYCPDHSTGVKFDMSNHQEAQLVDNSELLKGKQIVVIDSEDCPYCDLFKKHVTNDYTGTIPLTFRKSTQLQGLTITTPTWATPTILFMENGVEIGGVQGYLPPKTFYKALGYFKLGNTEAYRVAFADGTDSKFCKQYELFKNTPDGIFIDKVSGKPLFDTKDRYNSGSGWLSFTKAIEGAVYYKEDKSHGLDRTEVRAKQSDIHLGHVFDDGPKGKPRYCINATVLEFVARQ